MRAAEIIKPGQAPLPLPPDAGEAAIARLDRVRNASGRLKSGEIRLAMQRVMQNNCAVFRTRETLDEGVRKITDVAGSLRDLVLSDRSMIWNTDLLEALELDNLMAQAVVALHSAANRTESRGAHAREDFPDRDDKDWMKHTVVRLDDAGTVALDYRAVHLYTLSNEVQPFPPKARVY
jgi:succinate dehydrogenase / fumarate reductase flavoprotein subunit